CLIVWSCSLLHPATWFGMRDRRRLVVTRVRLQEQQLRALEEELRALRRDMAETKGSARACRPCRRCSAWSCVALQCGVCPPCPAQCNPEAPPCAMLRAEVLRRKDDAERERCLAREAAARLRQLELKMEGLATHTDMTVGTKEQAFEQEVSVRALKQCYRETREEADELRALLTEQGTQLQDYRVKIKFQEKLQELSPVPDLLKATQLRLADAQQQQAGAEHRAEQLARELNCAREKVYT
ncbi:hypothetical protein MSG28_001303, partial [Choristoneura fumiferana]